ncbi:hypothetical protein [Nitratireductor sp. GCM10026969]|uniref:hypothetical protein n=1 Tax=Nitratireductor sp. GCM10026969 TaxID=3252645 RepID=UPI00360C6274
MSTADFRHIAFRGQAGNGERLFRAAISSFCSLARPTRNELVQLDDLALGLYDSVPAEARRFAAAALCECDPAPPGLVRRLCAEPVGISAPLLVRSRTLGDVDLIRLIARHGLPHARAIARRDDLNPVVADLIRALIARAESAAEISGNSEQAEDALEEARRQLRAVMREAEERKAETEETRDIASQGSEETYRRLRDSVLAGDKAGFAAALAEALSISPSEARRLADGIVYSDLLTGLKALGLTVEQAFLISATAYPAQLAHAAGIRLFVERYQATSVESAREKVVFWRLKGQRTGAAPQSLASAR